MPDNLWREIAAQALLRSPGHIPPLSGRKRSGESN
jgi:3,4-dihydroxy-2-butanone 4-phosphate synthase